MNIKDYEINGIFLGCRKFVIKEKRSLFDSRFSVLFIGARA